MSYYTLRLVCACLLQDRPKNPAEPRLHYVTSPPGLNGKHGEQGSNRHSGSFTTGRSLRLKGDGNLVEIQT